ncbi:hypothetical protein TNCV_4614541 [Trichonephila clavipes]|nr:hypothetical protein TNCV_4614541 [Trichonephila clavipes]
MKISPDGQRSYKTCSHGPDIQLSLNHTFNCPFIYIGLTPEHRSKPHGPSTALFAKGLRHCKGRSSPFDFSALLGQDNN